MRKMWATEISRLTCRWIQAPVTLTFLPRDANYSFPTPSNLDLRGPSDRTVTNHSSVTIAGSLTVGYKTVPACLLSFPFRFLDSLSNAPPPPFLIRDARRPHFGCFSTCLLLLLRLILHPTRPELRVSSIAGLLDSHRSTPIRDYGREARAPSLSSSGLSKSPWSVFSGGKARAWSRSSSGLSKSRWSVFSGGTMLEAHVRFFSFVYCWFRWQNMSR